MPTFRSTSLYLGALLATLGALGAQDWYLEQPGQSPPARRFHGLANLGLQTILFGGVDERTGTVFGDTWRYDGSQWSPVQAAGPGARSRFAACTDTARARVLLFGGADGNGQPLGDTWAFDGTAWQPLLVATPPAPRIGAAMAYDAHRDRAVLFGGFSANAAAPLGDTCEFDGQQWIVRGPALAPRARHGHAMTFDSGRGATVLFGGFATGTQGPVGETWEWDGTSWRQVVTPTSPSAPAFPSMTFFAAHGLAVLVGGSGSASQPLATWVFDGVDWQAGPAAPAALFGRQGHAIAYDDQREAVVLFGGASIGFGGAVPRSDTWELAVQARFQSFGSGCDGGHGVPVLAARDGGTPRLGGSLVLDVAPAGPFAVLAVGASDTAHAGQPLPLDLSPFGLAGCALLVGIDAVLPATVTGGKATAAIHVPLRRDLIGLQLFVQALTLDAAAPLPGAVSNAGRATFGN